MNSERQIRIHSLARRLGLGVAAAALSATTLLVPAASAIGDEVPVADVQVSAMRVKSGTRQHTNYKFLVKNAGPDEVQVTVKKSYTKASSDGTGSGNTAIHPYSIFVLAPNELIYVTVTCVVTDSFACTGATVRAEVDGFDPNPGNNIATWQ